jgi:hypothetical protein
MSSSIELMKRHELCAHYAVILHPPPEARGGHASARLLDATQSHAGMVSRHDDSDTLGSERLLNGIGDLIGEALLNLEAL